MSSKMQSATFSVLLIITLLVAGCLGNNSQDNQIPEDEKETVGDEKDQPFPESEDIEKDPILEPDEEDETEEEPSFTDESELELIDSGITLEIDYDDDDPRTYDRINYTVYGGPSGSNITWDFDDDTILYGEKIIHFFRVSDYHIVNVTSRWEGYFAFGSIRIAVKNNDLEIAGHPEQQYYLAQSGGSLGLGVNEGISVPRAVVSIEMNNFTGEVDVGVKLSTRTDEGRYENLAVLEIETVNGFRSNIYREWEVSSDILKDYEEYRQYFIMCFQENGSLYQHKEVWIYIGIFY